MVSRKQPVYLALSFALAGLGIAAGLGLAARADSSVGVTVDANTSLGTIPATAFGINAAVWDGQLLDPSLPGLLQQAGAQVVRYPGGSTADVYHWQTNSTEPQQSYANPNNTFDAFMGVVEQTGAQAMITVNYGSGTPQEAAGWVRYANEGGSGYTGPVPTYPGASASGHTYGVTYWEIGNEPYGNGTYGADWEYDTHPKGATTYAHNAVQFIDAMKAVTPSIKVGVVLTAPGNRPDGLTASTYGDTMDWNDTVLSIACSRIDFVAVHWYAQNPGNESDAGLLSSTAQIAGMVAKLRSEISTRCGAHAPEVQIMTTETNAVSYNPGKQTVSLVNALFLDDNYMDWLENGVANVDWWDTHNSPVLGTNNSSSLYGTARYGDYGVLATGDAPEPAAETPFPPYDGLRMLTHLGASGDQMVAATSSSGLVAVHAVRQANGNLAVLLINKDPARSHTATLSLRNYRPLPNPLVYSYGQGSMAIAAVRQAGLAGTQVQTLAPYSLLTVVMKPDLD